MREAKDRMEQKQADLRSAAEEIRRLKRTFEEKMKDAQST